MSALAAPTQDTRRVTTVIADDEPLALTKLRSLLAAVPWINLVGEARDGTEAVAVTNLLKPELLFLDVVMPGLSGLDVLNQIDYHPTVVFTTAYDRFAVAAFETRALDYLLKPFGRVRLAAALDRVRESLDGRDSVGSVERGKLALSHTRQTEWIFVRERGRVTPVHVQQVIRFEGSDDYVSIHIQGRRLLATLRLSELERVLPQDFVRIHRSHIVNLAMVERFVTEAGARFTVVLRDGTRLAVSRDRARWLRERTI